MVPVLPIRFESIPPTPWANGRGTTVELYRRPVFGPFDVRLSIATISDDASFSPLAGVERVLMTLAADGLALDVGGRRVELAHGESVSFAGEEDVRAVDVAVPSRDLNLMVRRGVGVPRLETLAVEGRVETSPGAIAVIALTEGLTARGVELGFGDIVVGDRVAVRGSGTIAVASCMPAHAGSRVSSAASASSITS